MCPSALPFTDYDSVCAVYIFCRTLRAYHSAWNLYQGIARISLDVGFDRLHLPPPPHLQNSVSKTWQGARYWSTCNAMPCSMGRHIRGCLRASANNQGSSSGRCRSLPQTRGNWDPEEKVWHFRGEDTATVVQQLRAALPSLPLRVPPPGVSRLLREPLTNAGGGLDGPSSQCTNEQMHQQSCKPRFARAVKSGWLPRNRLVHGLFVSRIVHAGTTNGL